MTDAAEWARGIELDGRLIAPHLYNEFNTFQIEFDARTWGERQRMRSAFLQYVLTFTPELVPADLIREISHFLISARGESDYESRGWIELMNLSSAVFAYSGDPRWGEEIVGNLAHQSSWTRDRACIALAPAATRLNAFDPLLLDQCEANFEAMHFGSDMQICLFAAAEGDIDRKEAQLAEWAERYPDVCGNREMVWLARGGSIANPFAPWLNQVERYVMLRLASQAEQRPIQMLVPSSGSVASRLSATEVANRLERHPLGAYFVEVRGDAHMLDLKRRDREPVSSIPRL